MVFIVKYVKHLESIKLYSLRNSKDPCMYIRVKKQIIAHSWEATCTSLLNHIPPPSSKYTFTLIWVNQSLAVLYSISTCVHNSLPFLKVVPHKTPSGYLRSWKKKKKKRESSGHSVMSDSATPWTVAHQALWSMVFSKQEYWSGLPFLFPGDLPNPGIEPRSPELQADSNKQWEFLNRAAFKIRSFWVWISALPLVT